MRRRELLTGTAALATYAALTDAADAFGFGKQGAVFGHLGAVLGSTGQTPPPGENFLTVTDNNGAEQFVTVTDNNGVEQRITVATGLS